jgi:uncharacterized membrane protein
MSWWIGFISSFLASSVEVVEAVTIVLAAGITRGWRSTWIGVISAALVLSALVALVGPGLQADVPLPVLRVVIGTLLLIFGLQWLRKAVLRASGLKAIHDEEKIFQNEVRELSAGVRHREALDWTGFVVSFKGVFLEGLEVAFIVLTFGANSGRFDLSGAGAFAALAIVVVVGLAVHRPLTRVPENTIKFTVGLMLTAFGTFWGGEGVGVDWSLGDWTIIVLVAVYSLAAFLLVTALKRRAPAPVVALSGGGH